MKAMMTGCVIVIVLAAMYEIRDLEGQTPAPVYNVYVDGKLIGSEQGINFIPANGILQVGVDNKVARRIDLTPSYNSAVILTRPTLQSGICTYLKSTNGTTAYTATLATCGKLQAYVEGMEFGLLVDATCIVNCSLNIDDLGMVSIKLRDTATDPGLAPGGPGLVKGQIKNVRYVPAIAVPSQFVFVLME